MPDQTAGDLARFLEANPGPHRVGGFIVEHEGTFGIGESWATAGGAESYGDDTQF